MTLGLTLGLASAALSACATTPLVVYPTDTPTRIPPSVTPSPSPVWFPATPTNTPFPTPVVTPTLDVRPDYGAVLLRDDFSDPANWSLSRATSGRSVLAANELTIALSGPKAYVFSLRQATQLRDFYLEVTAAPSICRGEDEYGVLLRVSPESDFYRFSLTCQGQARVDRFLDGRASSPQPLIYSGAIPPGAPSQSRLGVAAVGDQLSFFANGEFLFTVREPSLPAGSIGFFARAAGEGAVTVNFSDLVVYGAAP